MNIDEFRENIENKITLVICKKRHPDMSGGWSAEMDTMVGKPLVIQTRNDEFAGIRSPAGNLYSFHYKVLDFYKEALITKLKWQKDIIECVDALSIDQIKYMSMDEDFTIFYKICRDVNATDYIKITETLLNKLQLQCPRIIGVLLSNNFMRRV